METKSKFDKQFDSMFAPADLVPELAACVEPLGDTGMQMLHHPLVVAAPYLSQLNGSYNAQLEHKRASIAEAVVKGNYERIVWMHERPYRLQAFLRHSSRMSPQSYWELLANVWVDAERPSVNQDLWLQLFTSTQQSRSHLMTPDENQVVRNLPDTLLIYRGVAGEGVPRGMSWTLSVEKAEFFARRYSYDNPRVFRTVLAKDKLLAYFESRGEQEVLVDPKDLPKQLSRVLPRKSLLVHGQVVKLKGGG